MIEKSIIVKLVDEWLQGKDYFLVDVEISQDNKIVVEIDHADGVWIEDCVDLSRYIDSNAMQVRAAYDAGYLSEETLDYCTKMNLRTMLKLGLMDANCRTRRWSSATSLLGRPRSTRTRRVS